MTALFPAARVPMNRLFLRTTVTSRIVHSTCLSCFLTILNEVHPISKVSIQPTVLYNRTFPMHHFCHLVPLFAGRLVPLLGDGHAYNLKHPTDLHPPYKRVQVSRVILTLFPLNQHLGAHTFLSSPALELNTAAHQLKVLFDMIKWRQLCINLNSS